MCGCRGRVSTAGRVVAHCDQLEHGVTVRLSDEVLHGRVVRRLELRSRLGGDGDIALENGSSLLRRDLTGRVLPRGASVAQAHLARRTGVVHPPHRSTGATSHLFPS